jgi:hypothetical protein
LDDEAKKHWSKILIYFLIVFSSYFQATFSFRLQQIRSSYFKTEADKRYVDGIKFRSLVETSYKDGGQDIGLLSNTWKNSADLKSVVQQIIS